MVDQPEKGSEFRSALATAEPPAPPRPKAAPVPQRADARQFNTGDLTLGSAPAGSTAFGGLETSEPLTDAQKAAIAELRTYYEAKLAEVELLHQGRMRSTFDPTERAAREQEYRRDRERLTSERDAKIEKARRT